MKHPPIVNAMTTPMANRPDARMEIAGNPFKKIDHTPQMKKSTIVNAMTTPMANRPDARLETAGNPFKKLTMLHR